MESPAEKAVKYAIDIIQTYQDEIRYKGLDKTGFCQGTVFQHAIPTIQRIVEGKFDPDGDMGG